ncbi:MAG: hypothetical protein JSU04_00190 [Bdellovibrionales bacterium]|nr:hypothetical protein [Bdellovibrionales bacterium]
MVQYKYSTPVESELGAAGSVLETALLEAGYEHDEVKGYGVDILNAIVSDLIGGISIERWIKMGMQKADELDITQYEDS